MQLLQLPQGLAQLPHLTCKDRTGQGGTGCSWTKEDKLGRGGGDTYC